MIATPDKLLWKPLQTAKALSISVSHLRTLTTRGDIPSVRLGHLLLYDPVRLKTWITGGCQKGNTALQSPECQDSSRFVTSSAD